jgi:DNA/RNA endonuclease YhcR with UshA esterase domain
MIQTSSSFHRVRPGWLPGLAGACVLLAACGDNSDARPDAAPPDAAPPTPPDAAPPDATPAQTIAAARALADGATATVEGYVTVAPGTFASATSEQGFAIQDATGGVYIKVAEKLTFGLDARVRVTGTLGQMNQLRVIEAAAADVSMLAGSMTVAPATVATGSVNEDVEGELIEVAGQVTRIEDDAPYGIKVYIDDGSGEVQVFVHLVEGVGVIDTAGLAEDDQIEVTGLAAQYETTYEVAPRKADDLVAE